MVGVEKSGGLSPGLKTLVQALTGSLRLTLMMPASKDLAIGPVHGAVRNSGVHKIIPPKGPPLQGNPKPRTQASDEMLFRGYATIQGRSRSCFEHLHRHLGCCSTRLERNTKLGSRGLEQRIGALPAAREEPRAIRDFPVGLVCGLTIDGIQLTIRFSCSISSKCEGNTSTNACSPRRIFGERHDPQSPALGNKHESNTVTAHHSI